MARIDFYLASRFGVMHKGHDVGDGRDPYPIRVTDRADWNEIRINAGLPNTPITDDDAIIACEIYWGLLTGELQGYKIEPSLRTRDDGLGADITELFLLHPSENITNVLTRHGVGGEKVAQ